MEEKHARIEKQILIGNGMSGRSQGLLYLGPSLSQLRRSPALSLWDVQQPLCALHVYSDVSLERPKIVLSASLSTSLNEQEPKYHEYGMVP